MGRFKLLSVLYEYLRLQMTLFFGIIEETKLVDLYLIRLQLQSTGMGLVTQ